MNTGMTPEQDIFHSAKDGDIEVLTNEETK
jgi:hypothetical protein